jgi:hypothetical protein
VQEEKNWSFIAPSLQNARGKLTLNDELSNNSRLLLSLLMKAALENGRGA